MKITNEAKAIISELLVSNDCDCLEVMQQETCCGTSIYFSLVKKDADEKTVSINGISVIMDDQAKERTETVTLSEKDGELFVQDDAPSCCC